MTFQSGTFFAFFLILLVLYYCLPRLGQKLLLLVASYVFYMWQMPQFGGLLLASTVISYVLALGIDRAWLGRKKLWLTLGCLVQFGLLFFYKYFDFLAMPVLRRILGEPGLELSILLPIGISFFTFAITGYLFDVYRGKVAVRKNFLDYAVFVAFFPSLLAGPIGKAREFFPQLADRHTFDLDRVKFGLLRFVFGMLEKMVVADTIAIAVNAAYAGAPTAGQWCIVLLLYGLQIYFDFAGYSHMALGVAEAFGFSLTENFKAPYFSTSVRDFWKKWHISLTSWFREYLYFPLGGSKKGTLRRYFNILVVFTVSGLWHGAAMTYIIWGLLNGLLQVAECLIEPAQRRLEDKITGRGAQLVWNVCKCGVTYLLICVTWLFFRAESLAQVWQIVGQIAGVVHYGLGTLSLAPLGLTMSHLKVLAVAIAVCLGVDALAVRGVNLRRITGTVVPYYLVFAALVMAVALFGVYGTGFDPQQFVYFKY